MRKAFKRLLKLNIVIAFILVFISIIFNHANLPVVRADEEPASTYTIKSAEELKQYSEAYRSGARNPKDTLNIAITSGSVVSDNGFISIGMSNRPFEGIIIAPTTGIDVFHLFNCPLFDYVTTDLKILGSGEIKIMRERPDINPSSLMLTSGSLFANHVVKGTNAASWKINLVPLSGGTGLEAYYYESLIGEIGDGASVSIEFINSSSIPVQGTANQGLICGTLGAGATLEVKTVSSGDAISVTTTGSNSAAGALVGYAKDSSTIKLSSANNTKVNLVKSNSGYAGGIAGYAHNVNIEYGNNVTDYLLTGEVNGKSAGGAFGYYLNDEENRSITLLDTFSIDPNLTIKSSNYSGGIFGVLESNGNITFDGNKASETLSCHLSTGNYRGGIAGLYKASDLSVSLDISNTHSLIYGNTNNTTASLIGLINNASYVNIHDVRSETPANNNINSGLIGSMGSDGAFVNLSGTIIVNGAGKVDSGLVASAPSGVLRIQGTTDLSGCKYVSTATSGGLVKGRSASLVYAIGDGSGINGNWTYLRPNLTDFPDDIAGWGEVLRVDGTTLKESDLFDVDLTNHTVTVKAEKATIANITDFAKTALNLQINKGDTGALLFASTTTTRSALLSLNITLGADINLASTGLLGLLRDESSTDPYTGTFDGGNHKITMAVGEVYGLDYQGNALASSSKAGYIVGHSYNGLFSKTKGATIKDLTVEGYFNLRHAANTAIVGGIVSVANGALNLNHVTTDIVINYYLNDKHDAKFGGAIGEVNGSGLNVSINNASNLNITINDYITTTNGITYSGGAIGHLYVDKPEENTTSSKYLQSITFDGISTSLTYGGSDANGYPTANRPTIFGGLIGTTDIIRYVKGARTVTINDVDINLDVKGVATSNTNFGGILGCEWLSLDTTITGLSVDASINTKSSSIANYYGGLTQRLTGSMIINSISLNSCNYVLPTGASTFGFVTNKANAYYERRDDKQVIVVCYDLALYLEINNVGDNYDISALSFNSGVNFTTYDELVATSVINFNDPTNNGNSVISIKTSNNVINTTGSTYNHYMNKTTYGQNNNKVLNPNVRYYYNLEYARANTNTSKYDLLIWTVGEYAHSSIKEWFNASTTYTGDIDLTGISYYPIDIDGASLTFTDATIKLDNYTMENYVSLAYTGATTARSTRTSGSQHYLMHSALFRNYVGTISFTNCTLRGNVEKLSDQLCGFIVSGNLGGSNSGNAKVTINGLVLDGVHIITNTGASLTSDVYAPLLFNKIGKNTNVSTKSLSTTNYTSYVSTYAGSSLYGDAGDANARAIYLSFSDIRLDSRTTVNNDSDFDDAYASKRSIFSRATILNSFSYFGESNGSYSFRIEEDWDNGDAIHHVTYGKEISSSSQYTDQNKYTGSEYYVDPFTYQATSAYSFASGYLPYVYTAYNANNKTYELVINLSFSSAIAGTGKYGDPFIIDNDEKLKVISNMIAGVDVGDSVTIELPSDLTSFNYTPTAAYTKKTYTFGADTFTTNGGSYSNANVRKYLCGAYYVITTSITLDSEYDSLGRSDGYPFRGVIVGRGTPTITNTSPNPLIASSTGAVIKDITVNVNVSNNNSSNIDLAAPLGSDTYDYVGGVPTYGAIIAKVMGGDTFIDNVNVIFTNATFNITAASSSNYPTLVPIGGYIGTLLNGGVIFRNMKSTYVGLTSSTFDKVGANSGYLYVNPIIGRVIAGYAFHETTTYHGLEEDATIKNGLKNYTIADLVIPSDNDKLSVSGTTVNIPNGQAMFIFASIVNTGAGCAAAGSTSEAAYDSISNVIWQAYRANTISRAGSGYSTVGSTDGDDYTAAQNDSLISTGLKQIPYIIRAYTLKSGNIYPARSAVREDGGTLNITGDCDVPAGFRGIGNIYYEHKYLRTRFATINGTSSGDKYAYQVTLHMRYLEYNHKNVSAYRASSNNNGVSGTAGFGLFNHISRVNGSSKDDFNKVVSFNNIILSGSVFYDVYTIAGVQSAYHFTPYSNDNYQDGNNSIKSPNDNTVDYHTNLSVGGLVGHTRNVFNITNVTFNNLEVEGAKAAGGLVGFVDLALNEQNNSLNPCQINYNATATSYGYVNVVGGLQAGGLIGRIWGHYITINGADSGTNIIINNIEMKSLVPNETGMTYGANFITGAGGLIGSTWSSRRGGIKLGNASARDLIINNINVTGMSNASFIKVRKDAANNVNYNNFAGGFIGTAHGALLRVSNSSVKDINISANTAGGIIGIMTQKYNIYLTNVYVGDKEATTRAYSITGTRHAGGIAGYLVGRDNFYLNGNGIYINAYNIISSYTGTTNIECCAGGLFGIIIGSNLTDNNANNKPYELNNIHIKKCLIETNYGGTSNGYSGTGTIAGALTGGLGNVNPIGPSTQNNYRVKISGYNVLFDDNTLKHLQGGVTDKSNATNNQIIGEVIGNNCAGSSIRIVGLSIKYTGSNEYCGKICGKYNSNNNEYGDSSYQVSVNGVNQNYGKGQIIFTDYNLIQDNEAFSNIGDTSHNVSTKDPFVTVNPKVTIGGYDFIGDAFNLSHEGKIAIDDLPIIDILSADPQNNNASIYSYVGSKYYSGSSGATNYANAKLAAADLSMFASEIAQSGDARYLDIDFPVLLIQDGNPNVHINSYLRMITNSTYDFSVDSPGHFSVSIYNMVYNPTNNTFTQNASGASLQRDSSGFYTIFNVFDSGKMQFSLIDVSFYNPTSPSEVVFHVYLPIFIKKVLSYKFDIAISGGTTYLESEYTDKFGEALIENVGSPVTAFFRYTYSRTAEEWTNSINSGENVLRFYKKTLYLNKANTSDTLAVFDPDTMLVLTGPNNGGKAYYARLGEALLADGFTLDLSKFKQMVVNNGVASITGEAFTPMYLCDLMQISVTASSSGLFVICNEEEATIRKWNDTLGDYQYFRLATGDDSGTKYEISVTGEAISEEYYLSIFTEADEDYNYFHYYWITSPSTFTENEYPAKILDTGSHTLVHLIMGKIFNHGEFKIETDTPSHTTIITLDNNSVEVNMSVEFGLRTVEEGIDASVREYLMTLISSTSIYQSFLIEMNRYDGSSIVKVIAGSPVASGSYGIDYVLDGQATLSNQYQNGDIRINHNYAEFVTDDLSSYFATGDKFEIVSKVSLTYLSSAAISAQFPGQSADFPDNGTTVSAFSNLSFMKSGTATSKNRVAGSEEHPKLYYSEDVPEYAALSLNPVLDRTGNITAMGINGLNPKDTVVASFDLLAVLDTTTVRSQIQGYASAYVSFELTQKVNGTYSEALPLSSYITSIKIGRTTLSASNMTDGGIVIPLSVLEDNGAYITLPVITVTVKKGSAIEADSLLYTNYKLSVSVTLLDENDERITSSHASNFIVYTNAKVVPDFIDKSN